MTELEHEFLHKTNNMIEDILRGPEGNFSPAQRTLKVIAEHLCISPHAKRARPRLCLYFHWLFHDQIDDAFVRVAVAAELIHAASLLHDDVVDEAEMRRGRSSANALFGNAQAVLGGDFLLSEAFNLLRPLGRELTDRAIQVVRQMTEAAIVEIDARGRAELSLEAWGLIARGKTGVLFSWCGFAAAIFAQSPADKERLWAVGEHIGQLFQMADDVKDFSGDKKLKDLCRDIRNKELSLPLILAAESDARILAEFKEYFQRSVLLDTEVDYLRDLVIASGAIEQTVARMQEAKASLIKLMAPYENSLGKACFERWVTELAY